MSESDERWAEALEYYEAQRAQEAWQEAEAQYLQAELDQLIVDHPDLAAQTEADPDKFIAEFGSAVVQAGGDFEAAYRAYSAAAAPPPPQTVDGATRELVAELRARRGAPPVG